MNLLTIFTPTYNRSNLIKQAYKSLIRQNCKDFEWIIVDDGSDDDTDGVIKAFINEGKISIKYLKQKNSGKHIAINRGLENASGTLFLILDSDDELTTDAVSTIKEKWNALEKEPKQGEFGGIVFNKRYSNGNNIGSALTFEHFLDETIIDFRFKRNVVGDKLEIFKTAILQQYPFPDRNEKFCPEALIWNRIGSKWKFRFFNKAIYVAEYLPGGLSSKIIKIRKDSPHNSATFYSELTRYDIPFLSKIKAGINYWRFGIHDKSTSFGSKFSKINPFLSLLTMPIGLIWSLKEKGV